MSSLEDPYVDAWDEWEASGEAALWSITIGDGLRGESVSRQLRLRLTGAQSSYADRAAER